MSLWAARNTAAPLAVGLDAHGTRWVVEVPRERSCDEGGPPTAEDAEAVLPPVAEHLTRFLSQKPLGRESRLLPASAASPCHIEHPISCSDLIAGEETRPTKT